MRLAAVLRPLAAAFFRVDVVFLFAPEVFLLLEVLRPLELFRLAVVLRAADVPRLVLDFFALPVFRLELDVLRLEPEVVVLLLAIPPPPVRVASFRRARPPRGVRANA